MGTIIAVYVAPKAGAPMDVVTEATCVKGLGIVEDRYGRGVGSFSNSHKKKGTRDEVTIYFFEHVVAMTLASGLSLPVMSSILRRNIFIEGIDSEAFKSNLRIRVLTEDGYVDFEWGTYCVPCKRPGTLSGIVDPGVLEQLMLDNGNGGVRVKVANVVGDGVIRPGHRVSVLP